MLTLTDSTFQKEVLDSKDPVLVDYWAPWCGPCKVMGPILDELDKAFKGKPITFAKMNVDDNSKTPAQFGVMSIPTLIIFKNGKPVEQFVGIQRKEDLKKKIDAILK